MSWPPAASSTTIICSMPRSADLLRRAGSFTEAAESYSRALELATNESERRFLERRLREVQAPQYNKTQ